LWCGGEPRIDGEGVGKVDIVENTPNGLCFGCCGEVPMVVGQKCEHVALWWQYSIVCYLACSNASKKLKKQAD
jgi:hypothetical protein